MTLETKIGQIYKHISSKSSEDVFLYDGQNNEDQNKTFVLASVRKDTIPTNYVFKTIVDTFCDEYPTALQSLSTEDRLSNLNYELNEIIKSEGSKWVNTFSCALIELNEKDISVATRGSISVYLIRDKRLIQLNSDVEHKNSDKIISSFLSGQIQNQDTLLVTLNNLLNYISTDQIIKILNHNQVEQAGKKIFKSIESMVPENESVVSLLINFQYPEDQSQKDKGINKIPKQTTRPKKSFIKKYKTKILIVLGIFIMLYAATSIINKVITQSEAYKITDQKRILQEIDSKLDDVKAALIYKNKEEAQKILKEVEDLLADSYNLNDNNSSNIKSWQRLQERWETLKTEIE